MNALCDDIYNAVFDDASLVSVCSALHAINPDGALLLHYADHETGRRSIIHGVGLGDAQLRSLERDATMLDLGLVKDWSVPPLGVFSNLDYVSRADVQASESWKLHFGRIGVERVDTLCLRRSGSFCLFMSIAYQVPSEDGVRGEVLNVLGELEPHLRRTMKLRARRLGEIDSQISLLVGKMSDPVALLGEGGGLVRCNAAAQIYLFGRRCSAAAGAGHAPLSQPGERFDDLVDALGRCDGDERAAFIKDRDGNGVLAYLSRLPFPQGSLLRAQRAAENVSYPVAIVVMKVGQGSTSGLAGELVEAFKFTPAERRLVEGLLAGRTMGEMAKSQKVAYNTLRNHLASVSGKTGVHRQIDLVRMLASLS